MKDDKQIVKPIAVPVRSDYLLHKYYVYFCECGNTLRAEYNFCPNCGKELNWDEDYD